MAIQKQLKIRLIKSPIAILPNHKACLKGLGLRKMHKQVILADNACTRGLINKINYLLLVEEA